MSVAPPPRVTLPNTDLAVAPFCLGANRFGAELDRDASFAVLDALVEAGGNFVDTAAVYADWHEHIERSSSEKTIGRWRAARGGAPGVVIATKGGHPRRGRPGPCLDRATLRADAEASRDHLGVPAIDLYYVHRDDPSRPVEEVLTALEELRAEGVIRHYAASNWTTPRLAAAAAAARARGWGGFVANQPEWSLAGRNAGTAAADLVVADAAMLAFHRASGLPLVPYSAQAKGYFDKRAAREGGGPAFVFYDGERNRRTGDALETIGKRRGATPTQTMLAFLRRLEILVVPVVGCYSPERLRATWAALSVTLDDADVALIRDAAGLGAAA